MSTVFLALESPLCDQLLSQQDSYLQGYFSDLYKYLHTGSPVYFVIKEGFNYSDPKFMAKFCSAAGGIVQGTPQAISEPLFCNMFANWNRTVALCNHMLADMCTLTQVQALFL